MQHTVSCTIEDLRALRNLLHGAFCSTNLLRRRWWPVAARGFLLGARSGLAFRVRLPVSLRRSPTARCRRRRRHRVRAVPSRLREGRGYCGGRRVAAGERRLRALRARAGCGECGPRTRRAHACGRGRLGLPGPLAGEVDMGPHGEDQPLQQLRVSDALPVRGLREGRRTPARGAGGRLSRTPRGRAGPEPAWLPEGLRVQRARSRRLARPAAAAPQGPARLGSVGGGLLGRRAGRDRRSAGERDRREWPRLGRDGRRHERHRHDGAGRGATARRSPRLRDARPQRRRSAISSRAPP